MKGETVTVHIGSHATTETTGGAVTTNTNHADHLGSTSVVTDTSGIMVQLLDYYPYGSERLNTGSADEQKTFIGEYSDDETGLSYLNARYYDGEAGRFTSQDSVFVGLGADDKLLALLLVSPQAQNSYSYGANNPIINKDPSGNCFWDLCVGETAAVALGATAFWSALAGLAISGPLMYGAVDSYASGDLDQANQYTDLAMLTYGGVAAINVEVLAVGAAVGALEFGTGSRVVKNVTVKSYGNTIYQGDRDLSRTLDGINSGSIGGKIYNNNEGLLPKNVGGYYQEFDVLDTPNWSGPSRGPERIIVGQGGEKYYSPDHLKSFVELE